MPHSRQRPLIAHEIEKMKKKLKLVSKTHRGIAKHKLPSQTKQVKSESREITAESLEMPYRMFAGLGHASVPRNASSRQSKPLDNSTKKDKTHHTLRRLQTNTYLPLLSICIPRTRNTTTFTTMPSILRPDPPTNALSIAPLTDLRFWDPFVLRLGQDALPRKSTRSTNVEVGGWLERKRDGL
jgi:hypothetical protein